MDAEKAIAERFHCPKCRGRQCATHHVALPQSGLPLPFGRYIVSTCALCGYSEFHDLAVLESLGERTVALDDAAAVQGD